MLSNGTNFIQPMSVVTTCLETILTDNLLQSCELWCNDIIKQFWFCPPRSSNILVSRDKIDAMMKFQRGQSLSMQALSTVRYKIFQQFSNNTWLHFGNEKCSIMHTAAIEH